MNLSSADMAFLLDKKPIRLILIDGEAQSSLQVDRGQSFIECWQGACNLFCDARRSANGIRFCRNGETHHGAENGRLL